jgi:hypothetical protein
MIRLLTLILSLICPLAGVAQSTSPVNYAALADLAVRRSWHLTSGERVVMFWDRASDRGMAEALLIAIKRVGGVVE